MGGILTGPEISVQVERKNIRITDFDPKSVNPASYDLRLGSKVRVYQSSVKGSFNCDNWNEQYSRPGFPGENLKPSDFGYIDSAINNATTSYEMDDRGLMLKPGIGYLMHTEEKIWTDSFVPILDGKSSIGRLFCVAHQTAGLGDPGFDGQYTLEVVVVQPTVVYPNMKFCQIRFFQMFGERLSYSKTGNYQGELAVGPVPSLSWKQFRK